MVGKPAADRKLKLKNIFAIGAAQEAPEPFYCCRSMHEQDWPVDVADESLGAAPEN